MNCSVCGTELEANEQQCSKCKEFDNKVQVLTVEESQHFSGITLEDDHQEEKRHDQYQASHASQQIYSRQFNINSTSFFTKLLLGIILLGVVFIALPILLFFLSVVGIIIYMVRK